MKWRDAGVVAMEIEQFAVMTRLSAGKIPAGAASPCLETRLPRLLFRKCGTGRAHAPALLMHFLC